MLKEKPKILIDDLEDCLTTKKDGVFKKQVLDYLAQEKSKWEATLRKGVDPKQYDQVNIVVQGIKSAENFLTQL
jgi:MOSC domain-containing protein YiiM